jgi:hypothetical protein
MVFEKTMKRVADYSVNLFGMLDDDLPPRMVKTIKWILYSAMPFFLNIAYFGLLISGLWFLEQRYGVERIIVLLTAILIFKGSEPRGREDRE